MSATDREYPGSIEPLTDALCTAYKLAEDYRQSFYGTGLQHKDNDDYTAAVSIEYGLQELLVWLGLTHQEAMDRACNGL